MIPILRDAGLSDLVASSELAHLARGFQFTEGPLWCPDGSLLFQDIKAERTFRLVKGRDAQILREQTRAANGQTFGPGGAIVFCEQNGRRVSRMDADGRNVTTVAESWSGARLNSPNDIVCRSDGLVYFTDPPYGVEPSQRSLHFQGVFRARSRPRGKTTAFVCWLMISRSPTGWPFRLMSERFTSAIPRAITCVRSRSNRRAD